jgi:Cu+-exporting ATPase
MDKMMKYVCPMQCEGDKTYNQPGDCPVCNMHLIQLKEKDESQESHPAGSGLHDHKHQITLEEKGTQYYCPMKCEGNKAYDEPGICPVCNMHLVPVGGELLKTNGHHQHYHLQHKETTETASKGKYYCPMRCEGDKMYDKPGDCPVCGMHLLKEESRPTGRSKTIYTCPMHPEVKQDHPGSCPKCGMDLVPEKGEVVSEEEKAYKNMARKFWLALSLSVPVFIIAMSGVFRLNLENIV